MQTESACRVSSVSSYTDQISFSELAIGNRGRGRGRAWRAGVLLRFWDSHHLSSDTMRTDSVSHWQELSYIVVVQVRFEIFISRLTVSRHQILALTCQPCRWHDLRLSWYIETKAEARVEDTSAAAILVRRPALKTKDLWSRVDIEQVKCKVASFSASSVHRDTP